MTTATKIFQTSKFGLPNLASVYLNPGRSACPPFLNKVYRWQKKPRILAKIYLEQFGKGYYFVFFRIYGQLLKTNVQKLHFCRAEQKTPWARFSKVRKLFGRISGDIIPFVSSQRRRLEARDFAVILIFILFTTYEKASFTE